MNGWEVRFLDPAPNSEAVLNKVLDKARRWVPEVYDQLPPEGALTLCENIADAVSAADWVQESTPERLEIKQPVLAEIQANCAAEAILASSTSGFMPSELQAGSARPEQILVAHPYNPVYLLPIVEVVPFSGGARGNGAACGSLTDRYRYEADYAPRRNPRSCRGSVA